MYTTKTADREQVLKAVAATHRAMERHACSKSQFKFKCFSCGEMINRGDKITRCIKETAGMTLRYRGAGGECGLTMAETAFYQATTGKDMWVHIGCNPCYWDEGFDNGDESSPPALRGVPTEWGCKVDREFEDWTSRPGGEVWINNVDLFLKIKGYPKEKSMRARIIQAVTRFQALWRGYIYKKAYPIARLDAIATRVLNEAGLEDEDWTQNLIRSLASGGEANWLQSGQEVPDLITKRQQTCWEEEWRQNNGMERWLWSGEGGYHVGDHIEVLFNENQQREALYSGEIIEVQYRGSMSTKIKVKFHYDGEVRNYTGEKFNLLKREGEEHKRRRGIEANFTGRIFTKLCSTKKKKKKKRKKKKQKEEQDDEGDLFLLDY